VDTDTPKDFFISYTHPDQRWAAWIVWHLEEAGYSTLLQAWDFQAGSNFVLTWMPPPGKPPAPSPSSLRTISIQNSLALNGQ